MAEPFEHRLRSLLSRAADRDDFASADHLLVRIEGAHLRHTSRRTRWAVVAGFAAVVLLVAGAVTGVLAGQPWHRGEPGPGQSQTAPPSPSATAWRCAARLDPIRWFDVQPIRLAPFKYVYSSAANGPFVTYQPVAGVLCRYLGGNHGDASFTLHASATLSAADLDRLVDVVNALPPAQARVPCPYDHSNVDVIALTAPDGTVQEIQRHRSGCGQVTDGVRYHIADGALGLLLDSMLGPVAYTD